MVVETLNCVKATICCHRLPRQKKALLNNRSISHEHFTIHRLMVNPTDSSINRVVWKIRNVTKLRMEQKHFKENLTNASNPTSNTLRGFFCKPIPLIHSNSFKLNKFLHFAINESLEKYAD